MSITTKMTFTKYIPTRMLFGNGQLNHLHECAMPGKKAMIIISNGKSTRANGYLERTENELHMAGVDTVVFDGIEANPLRKNVMDGARFANENGCDFLVALGGGSCMDAGKGIALVATNGGDLWDYIRGGSGKAQPITKEPLPLVCITTTAGTGSEIDMGAAFTNEVTKEKVGLKTEELFPVLSIVDPELTLSVPPAFTMYQGFDALAHSLEGYVSNQANAMSDIFALAAIEHVGHYLARAVRDGSDLEAREHVLLGNSLSGMLMDVGGVTSMHALEDTLSGYHHTLPHGAGLMLLADAYFRHMITHHYCDARFVRMAQAMGMEGAAKPEDFLTVLRQLLEDCGYGDMKMSDFGITPDEFEQAVRDSKTVSARLFTHDLIPLSDEDCLKIYQESYR